MKELDEIPKVISGSGKKILNEMIRPLLKYSFQYDRVSSYYNPRSLALLLEELAEIWKRKGTIRLIITFQETVQITPSLKNDVEIEDEIRNAVAKALQGAFKELKIMIEDHKKDIRPILRELIEKDAIHVRLVIPKASIAHYKKYNKWPKYLFHSKFAIFHHDRGLQSVGFINKVKNIFQRKTTAPLYYRPASRRLKAKEIFSVLNGSVNESRGGYGENIEDAVLHRSWVSAERDVAIYFVDRFEQIWADTAEDVKTMVFDDEFTQVVRDVVSLSKTHYFRWEQFEEITRKSPTYNAISLPNLGLLPHQIRVYRDGLSRWPIRVLLADEVGLGKTIEAGAILHYLIKFKYAKKILILTPASLRYQWQRELKSLFNLDFWVYNPTKGICENGNETAYVGKQPLSGPDRLILSWHWARLGTNHEKCRFTEEEMPDVLIVDEAHHARLREDDGPTLLFMLLNHLKGKIPHVIFATATPFQTCQLDYYSLLILLGIPDWFNEIELYNYARWTKGELPDNFSLQVKHIKNTHSTILDYQVQDVDDSISSLLDIPDIKNTEFYEEFHRTHGKLSNEIIFLNHPTNLLTIRNTRTILKNFGYHFPHIHLSGAEITMTKEQLDWLQDFESYIQTRLGSPEKLSNPNWNIGMIRSLYRQRAVSSIKAARDTLQNRKELLIEFEKAQERTNLKWSLGEEFDPAENDEEDSSPELRYPPLDVDLLNSFVLSAKNEKSHIERLLIELETLFTSKDVIVDPKLERLKTILQEHLDHNRKVLVFSRFTSTTSAIIEEIEDFIGKTGVGRFDGKMVGTYKKIKSEIQFTQCSREEIVEYLKTSKINILVCSDAASEGLNLHASNVAINVDIPWNPSRLLQRFGRVDRLGQKADDVYLINMYYPGTIEERMYRVLEDKRIDFRALFGEVPEILSEQQRDVVLKLSTGDKPEINLTFELIEEGRQRFNKNQYKDIISKDFSTQQRKIKTLLIQMLKKAVEAEGQTVEVIDQDTYKIGEFNLSPNPMSDDYHIWGKFNLSKFEKKVKGSGQEVPVCTLTDKEGMPLSIVLIIKDKIFPLSTNDWPSLFRFFFIGTPIKLNGITSFPINETNKALQYIFLKESWMYPNHSQTRCITPTPQYIPSYEDIKVSQKLGSIVVDRVIE